MAESDASKVEPTKFNIQQMLVGGKQPPPSRPYVEMLEIQPPCP